MSTEMVLVPAVPLAAAGGTVLLIGGGALLAAGGTAVLAGKAALGVKHLVDRERERAGRERERERATIAARLEAREKATAAQRAEACERAVAREFLEQLGTLAQAPPAPRTDAPAGARDFLGKERRREAEREQALAGLAAIEANLERILQETREDAQAPFARLAALVRAHRARLADGSHACPDIAGLHETAKRTIATYFARIERTTEASVRLRVEAEALLDQALECRELALDAEDRDEAGALVRGLVGMVKRDRPQAGTLDALRRQLAAVSARVEGRVQAQALSAWLGDRLVEHLAELDYEALEPFGPAAPGAPTVGLWRVPGGAQVRLALHADGRLATKLTTGPGEAVDLKCAEARWCADAREILRRLTADGVPYRIGFERRLPDLPVAAMETAEELFREEEEQRARAAALARQSGRKRP
ncbi:MAG: hypothetical protein HLUCCA12_17700 [Rhodobacteraceae bacterium HLUCCA12]|nr:MAG: hypothetical protein HLUCCA12_17700 [Rhodobacteraceae bacterium HLUCCA12]